MKVLLLLVAITLTVIGVEPQKLFAKLHNDKPTPSTSVPEDRTGRHDMVYGRAKEIAIFQMYYLKAKKEAVLLHKAKIERLLYKGITVKARKDIPALTNAILKYSNMYKVDASVIAAIVIKESSGRSWIKHKPVTVAVPLAPNWTKVGCQKVQAIGAMGVIWEIWKYDLKKIGLTKKDLFTIDGNIKAGTYIYKKYMDKPKIKGAPSKRASALSRFYGIVRDKSGKLNLTYYKQVQNIIDG